MMDDIERDLLSRTWFPVCREQDLSGGGVVGARILDRDLTVFASGGRITVAQGRCPHRGMALWRGQICDGDLQCPYHGWRFAPVTGRCTQVPALDRDELPDHIGLVVYASRTAYGHVWASLDEPYLPFPIIAGFEDRTWSVVHGEPQDVSCGLRQMTENFRDLGHLPFVHGSSMGDNVQPKVPRYKVYRGEHTVEWSRTTRREDNGSPAKTLTYRVMLPSLTSIHTEIDGVGSRLLAQIATPVSSDGDRIRLFWLAGVDDRLAATTDIDLAAIKEYESQIFAEDVAVVEHCHPAEAPLDLRAQVHTRADRFSIGYRRVYRDLLDRFAAARRPNSAAGSGAIPDGVPHTEPAVR